MIPAFAVYLAIHLAAYVAWLRRLALLRTEKGIFLYHFGSAVLTGLLAVAAAFSDPAKFDTSEIFPSAERIAYIGPFFLEIWPLT